MKVTRTANLDLIKIWLFGGRKNECGGFDPGFCIFRAPYSEDFLAVKDSGHEKIDILKIKYAIIDLIGNFGEGRWEYYGKIYRFKIPSDRNLDLLVRSAARIIGYQIFPLCYCGRCPEQLEKYQ